MAWQKERVAVVGVGHGEGVLAIEGAQALHFPQVRTWKERKGWLEAVIVTMAHAFT